MQHNRKAKQTMALPEVFSTPCNGPILLKRAQKHHRCRSLALLRGYQETLHSPLKERDVLAARLVVCILLCYPKNLFLKHFNT